MRQQGNSVRKFRNEIRNQYKEMMLEALEGHYADEHVFSSIQHINWMITRTRAEKLAEAMKIFWDTDNINTQGALLDWEAIVGYLEGVKAYLMRHSRD